MTLLRRLVYVAFFFEVGLLLLVLPWSAFWDRNYFVFTWPVIGPFLTNNFVRGGVTGLGAVNVFAGVADLALVFSTRAHRDASRRAARVTLCLVTDRRVRPVVEQCGEAVRAGVDMIQVRERDLDGRSLASLVAELVRLTRGTATRVVVNDRLDVALACGADGVHLRGDSMPPALGALDRAARVSDRPVRSPRRGGEGRGAGRGLPDCRHGLPDLLEGRSDRVAWRRGPRRGFAAPSRYRCWPSAG